jgi:hypothetical protein
MTAKAHRLSGSRLFSQPLQEKRQLIRKLSPRERAQYLPAPESQQWVEKLQKVDFMNINSV